MPRTLRLVFLAVVCAALCVFSVGPAQAQPRDALPQARELLMRGQPSEAEHLLACTDSLSPQGHYWLGRARQSLLQHADAAHAFSQADTSAAHVLAAWGQSLHQLGRTSEALRKYRRSHARDSTRRPVRLALIDLHAEAGRWDRARDHLQHLLRSAPSAPTLHAKLAQAHRAMNALGPAIEHYEQAQALNPYGLKTALRLAGLYQQVDSVEAARRVLHQAAQHHPTNTRLWRQRGQLAFQAGRPDSAIAAYRRALHHGDSTAAALRGLGKGFYLTGRYAEAFPHLQTAQAKDSTHAPTMFFLGVIHNSMGRPDSALHYLNRAANRFGRPTLANIYEQIADVHKQREAYADAIDANRTALALAPRKVAVLFHLATVYDTYYADPGPARTHYRLFLRRTDAAPHAHASMRAYAQYRLERLDERQFLHSAPAQPATDTAR